jgi:hypothetical protein
LLRIGPGDGRQTGEAAQQGSHAAVLEGSA